MNKIKSLSASLWVLRVITETVDCFRETRGICAINVCKVGAIASGYVLFINWLLFGELWFAEWNQLLESAIIALGIVAVMHGMMSVFLIPIRNRVVAWKSGLIRIPIGLIVLFLVNGAAAFLVFFGFLSISTSDYSFRPTDYPLAVSFIAVVDLTLLISYVESVSPGQQSHTISREEITKEISLPVRFAKLKDQIRPHFLFNCLNSLSSLISEDPVKANRFLNELSKVYRYLLHNNFETLVTVEQEIKFIRSYYHLLETRYSGIYLNISIEDRYKQCLLPPLTLQLLVENAIKHNIIQEDMPLFIDVFIAKSGMLVIKNNKQAKLTKLPSTGIGLKNIQDKYQLLDIQGIQIEDNDAQFKVTVPLIKKEYEMV